MKVWNYLTQKRHSLIDIMILVFALSVGFSPGREWWQAVIVTIAVSVALHFVYGLIQGRVERREGKKTIARIATQMKERDEQETK